MTTAARQPKGKGKAATIPTRRRKPPPPPPPPPRDEGGWLAIEALKPWDKNPRVNDVSVPRVARSIQRFGFVAPIVIWRGGDRMVAGHTRLKAMQWLLAQPEEIDKDGRIVAGPRFVPKHAPGAGVVRVVFHEFDSEADANAYAIADNRLGEDAEWDGSLLAEILVGLKKTDEELLAAIGFGDAELVSFLANTGEGDKSAEAAAEAAAEGSKKTLGERFGVPPFSVLDARQGYWQDRKRAWLALGFKSEEGRGSNLLGMSVQSLVAKALGDYDAAARFIAEARGRALSDEEIRQEVLESMGVERGKKESASLSIHPYDGGQSQIAGTSIFDPVLCELLYRWFSPPGGEVLDPFAGGSVRGVVAFALGRSYTGCELRAEQVQANREQLKELGPKLSTSEAKPPVWIEGDSAKTIPAIPKKRLFDFVLSCPPYADLEVYSEDPRDLSTMAYAEFRETYRKIIAASCARLRSDRFAAFVVGEVREKGGAVGAYRGFVQDTIRAFENAGLAYYNEAILVTATGSVPLRASRMFSATRKLGKTHQNVLVFCKGDPRKAVEAIGDSEFGDGELASGPGAASAPNGDPFGEVLLDPAAAEN